MVDVELSNLSEECERVRIGNKSYRFVAKPDEIRFEKLPKFDPVTGQKRAKGGCGLKIKTNDLLFVRRRLPNEGRRKCCNSEHLYTIVSYKHFKNLLIRDSKIAATVIDNTPTANVVDQQIQIDIKQSAVVYSCSLGIYHVLRISKNRWRVALLVCYFPSEALREKWYSFLRSIIADKNRPKRLLIFLNPFGGKGRASEVFKNYVDSILKLCDINSTVITTQRANHAREVVCERDLTEFDGILSVGGDGLFNEVMNGVLSRTQRDAKIDINDRNVTFVAPEIKLAAIPAGSTNALAYTIHGTDDPQTAVLHVCLGDNRGIDVCSIHCGAEFHSFACTAVSFGYLGAVLKESEKLRRFGPPRYLISGVKTAFRHQWYKGKIELEPNRTGNISRPSSTLNVIDSDITLQKCHSKCDLCKFVENEPQGSAKVSHITDDSNTLVDEEFLHLVGIITPCLSKLSPCGLSPTCHLGDGVMHLAIISRISRCQNFSFIWKVMSRRADHMTQPYVKLKEVTGFSFTPSRLQLNNNLQQTPEESDRKKGEEKDLGTWNVDGEMLAQPQGTIHFRMRRQLMTMYARGIEMEEVNEEKGNCDGVTRPAIKLQNCCCSPI